MIEIKLAEKIFDALSGVQVESSVRKFGVRLYQVTHELRKLPVKVHL